MEHPSTITVADSPEILSADPLTRQESVLVIAADPLRRSELGSIIESAGWLALRAGDASEALELFREAPPDLVLVAFSGIDFSQLETVDLLRAEPEGNRVPIVCNLARRNRRLLVESFARRADDVVVGRPVEVELIARLRTRMERRALPRNELQVDPITGALVPWAFREQTRRELERVYRGGRVGVFAYLAIDELPAIDAEHGSRARDEIVAQIIETIEQDSRSLDFVGFSRGIVGLLMPATPLKGAQTRLDRLSKLIFEQEFVLRGTMIRLTPIIGYSESDGDLELEEVEDRAWAAMAYEAEQRDLHPTRWDPAMSAKDQTKSRVVRLFNMVRTPMQVIGQQAIALGLPLAFYLALDSAGLDFTGVIYLMVVGALFVTSVTIVAESRAARSPAEPPEVSGPRPVGSAIIAAYLPNEADTIIETPSGRMSLLERLTLRALPVWAGSGDLSGGPRGARQGLTESVLSTRRAGEPLCHQILRACVSCWSGCPT